MPGWPGLAASHGHLRLQEVREAKQPDTCSLSSELFSGHRTEKSQDDGNWKPDMEPKAPLPCWNLMLEESCPPWDSRKP